MKNFAKKLALFLALAMVVTVLTPSTINVSAASKITLKSGAAAPASVYAGHSYVLKVAGTTCKFYSSNKSVATIGLTTGKFKPVAPGTVKITAKNKKTGKTVATKSFTVLQRATAVTSDPAELYLGAVGDTATLKAVKTPATSTDVVKFFTADKTIATVGMTSGKVTAKAEGKTTISVYAMATKATSKSSKYNKVATVNVFVGPYMASAVQTSTTTMDLTFKADLKEVKATDFTVTNDATKVTYPVKDAKISATDAKVVTITTYSDIKDGGNYTVSYAKTSAQFKATDGVVAGIAIDPTTVTVKKETKINVVAKDANGVVVGKYDQSNLPSDYELTITPNDGYLTSDGALCLSTLTSTAKASAKYHSTWKYEDNKEVGLFETGDVTITATEADSVTSSGFTYTIDNKAPSFTSSSFKQKTDLCVGDNGYYAYFKIVDSSNTEISNYADYTVESSNNEILMVTSSLGADKCVAVQGIKAGTAYLVIKNATTKATVNTLAVTVKAARKETSVSLSNASVNVSTSDGMAEKVVTTTIKVLDQYGEKMTVSEAPAVTLKSYPANYDKTAEAALNTVVNDQITTKNGIENIVKGVYRYEVKYKNLPAVMFTVNVQEPSATGAIGFTVTQSADTIDAVINSSDDTDKSISITPVMTKGDVPFRVLDADGGTYGDGMTYSDVNVKLVVKNSSGTDVTAKYMNVERDKFNVVAKDASGYIVVTPADTYTFTYTIVATKVAASTAATTPQTTTRTIIKTVKVTNSQAPVTYTRVSNICKDTKAFTYTDKALNELDAVLNECYTFYYDGQTFGKNGTAISDASAEFVYSGEKNVAFKNVTITIPVAKDASGNAINVKTTVDMPSAFTVTIG